MNYSKLISSLLLIVFAIPQICWSGTAICKILIEDINKSTSYKLEQKFDFIKDGAPHIKEFETPGNDYACRLAFFELENGSAISCEYKKDNGHTIFQSDRSLLNDEVVTNNLSFRHQEAFINIKTVCE